MDVDTAVNLNASSNGTAVGVDKNNRGFAMGAVISSSSSLNGVLKLQANIDAGGTPSSAGWADIPNSSQTVTTDGATIWNCDTQNFRWVRIVYTRTGGSGTMTTTFNENS